MKCYLWVWGVICFLLWTVPALSQSSSCDKKNPDSYISAIFNDFADRPPSKDELTIIKRDSFQLERIADAAFNGALYNDAAAKFLTNLFRLNSLTETTPENRDLQQEPIVLVKENSDKPWSYFFNTRNFFCTKNTAALYDLPSPSASGFVSCRMEGDRSGFLGLVSTLRITSPNSNPQAFYLNNNNYHRVQFAIYLATGVRLQAATNGPKGKERGIPMASCVPTSDMRKTTDGLIYGTAAIPLVGSACAACHSTNMGPLSIAFRKFDTKGNLLNRQRLMQALAEKKDVTTPTNELQALLKEDHTCWTPIADAPPTTFNGLSGLGDVMASSSDFGRALAIQMPQHLANVEAPEPLIEEIKKSFDASDRTLRSAMKAFAKSSFYTCQ